MEIFLGSILDPESDKTQYLYIWAKGGDGKSTFTETLHSVLASAMYVTSGTTYRSQFGKAAIEGKRLIIFQEEKNSDFLSSSEFKELTGDQVIEVQRKYHDNYQVNVLCKIIVISNDPPFLNGGRADMRRIIPVRLQGIPEGTKIDTQFKHELKQEAHDVLRYCWHKYQAWKTANPYGEQLGDTELLKKIGNTSVEQLALGFIDAMFEKANTGDTPNCMTMETFQSALNNFSVARPWMRSRVQSLLEEKFDTAPGSVGIGAYGYAGVRLVSRTNTEYKR
jgi:phage/plasmid-associated DNA primase